MSSRPGRDAWCACFRNHERFSRKHFQVLISGAGCQACRSWFSLCLCVSVPLESMRFDALVVALCFDAVAAGFHVAPSAAMVFRLVQEEPGALVGGADAQVGDRV